MHSLIVAASALYATLFPTATATPLPLAALTHHQDPSAPVGGAATFYGGNVHGGTCSFSNLTLPAGIRGTALSRLNWDTASHCGACVAVTGPDGDTVTAMIVDQCPGCGANQLDLFAGAFAAIADEEAGRVGVRWAFVPCGVAGPVRLRSKEGASRYWFSMQVVNANVAVDALQVSTDGGGTWLDTRRSEYNYFERDSGFGTERVDVRVTGSNGKTVVVKDVKVSGGSSKEADSNF